MSDRKFDVFLSHNSKDKPQVEQLAERLLEDYGVRSWIDKWDLIAAKDWEPELQKVLASCDACAVLLGEHGWGNYHLKEARAALNRQEQHSNFRVIPVLLPNASESDMKLLGDFFQRTHRVELPNGISDEQAYQSLVAAVRGRSPGPPLMSVYRIVRDAERWQQSSPKDKSKLYLGRNLQEAQRIAQQHADQLSELAVKFLSVSALEVQRVSRWRSMILITVVIVLATLALLAWWQRNRAVFQANVALARQLAAQSEVMRDQQASLLPRSVLLAIEAARRFPSFETEQALRHELDLLPRLVKTINLGSVSAVTSSPDGEYLAMASGDNAVRVRRSSDGEEVVHAQLSTTVEKLCYSLDGRYLVAVSPEGFAQLLEANTGHQIASVKYPELDELALNSDGLYTAISNEKIAQVLETKTGREIGRFEHRNLVNSVALSPDARYLATASDDNSAHVWELGTNRELARFPHKQDVTTVVFSSDGRYLATASNDTVLVSKAPNFDILTRIVVNSPVWELAFNADGHLLALVSADKVTSVWTVRSGREVARIVPDNDINSLSLTPDGVYLTATSKDGLAWRWELTGGHEVTRVFHEWGVSSVTFSPESRYIATASDDSTARICEVEGGKEIARLTHKRELRSVSYSPKARYLITSSLDYYANPLARVFTATGQQELTGFASEHTFRNAFFSPDEKYLVTLADNDTIEIWEVANRQRVAHIKGEEFAITTVDPSGNYLVTAGHNNLIQLWKLSDGRLAGQWTNTELGEPKAFSADGKYLASADKNIVRVWETTTGNRIAQMKNEDEVDRVIISPNGEYLATAGKFGKTVQVWFTKSGQQVTSPLVHLAFVRTLAFSHDAVYLASTDEEKNVRLWEVKSAREVARLSFDENVSSVAFSANDRYLATGSMDGLARVWRVAADDLIIAACARLTRNLTKDEWSQYLGGESYVKTCANLP